MRLIVVRHAQSVGNAGRIIQGNVGGELSAQGRNQALQLARSLPSAAYVYSSDLNRALETAQIIAAEKKLPLMPTFALREGHLGHLEGRPWKEYVEYDWSRADLDQETIEYQIARLKIFLRKLREKHGDATIILVTHSGTMRALVAIARDTWEYPSDVKFANACASYFAYDGKLTLEKLNVGVTDTDSML